MNDDFLTRFRKAPRKEFSADLYERINTPMNTRRPFTFRKWMLATALCAALIAAVAFSPSARAALQTLIRQIGEITYIGPDETSGHTITEAEVTIVPEETLPIDEARTRAPYELSLPEWTPDGYTMSQSARVTYFPSAEHGTAVFVAITFTRAQETSGLPYGFIELVVSPEVQWMVDLDHLEEVQVNGQPAGLTGGGWDADSGQWETTYDVLTLTWMIGDEMYQLRSSSATVEELIQMAESIP